jgi:hypothetical protein
MRWAAALAALALAGVLAAAVFAITRSHDTPPDDVEACAVPDGARRARGEEGLRLVREDVRAGTLRPARRYRLDDDRAVLLQGTGARVLVIGVPGGPSLHGDDLAFRVYRRTASFATVLTERDPVRVLDRCAREVAG